MTLLAGLFSLTSMLVSPSSLAGRDLSVIRPVGWTLVHFCWQGAAVAMLLWCVLRLLAEGSSRARYAATCAALLAMVVMPLATFAHLAAEDRAARAHLPMLTLDMTITANGGGGAMQVPWTDRAEHALDEASPWIFGLWLAGLVVFAGRLQIGLMVARRMRSVGTEEAPAELQAIFARVARRIGVTRVAHLMHSARVQAPTVIGWLRPVVLMPAGCLAGLSTAQVEALLAHELAHIRRHDYLVSVLQSMVETLLFYHPAVWWVSRQMRRERECCCDEMAVRVGGDRLAYARALSLLEEQRSQTPALVLGANGGVLTMRIKRLLGLKECAAVSQMAAGAVLALTLGVCALSASAVARAELTAAVSRIPAVLERARHGQREMALDAPVPMSAQLAGLRADALVVAEMRGGFAAGAAQDAGSGPALRGVYKMWLEQDALWIITAQERAAFLRLTNDAERDEFIAQFWKRRDAPGAAENSAREQHYARIAYTNEHFASNTGPGWKTDRGHVYIAYGKPDSIDSHPGGGGTNSAASPFPFEVWQYNSMPGVGQNVSIEFVDTCKCGEYHYTIDGSSDGARSLASPEAAAAAIPALPDGRSHSEVGSQRVGMIIRQIDFKGLNSVTLTDVTERFRQAHVGLAVETPYDPAQFARVVQVLGELLAEHGLRSALVAVSTRPISPGAIGILFTVREGAKSAVVPAAHEVSYRGPAQASAPAAQADGAIAGVVFDPVGAVVARASVTAVLQGGSSHDTKTFTYLEPGVQAGAQSDQDGRYSISKLLPGSYNVMAFARGFARLLQENVLVQAGQTVGLNLKLSVGAASENVTVTGSGQSSSAGAAAGAAAASGTGPVRVSAAVMAGSVVTRPNPIYPADAKAAHVSGTVVLHATIGKTGAVENLTVVSGPEMLQSAALDAVRRWTYKPYLLNGQPVAVDTSIRVNFTFGGDGPVPPQVPAASGSAGANRPIRVSAGVMAGALVTKVDPVYPAEAKAARVQGAVVLHAVISKEGKMQNLQVVSGPKELVTSALDAVNQWTYKPYLLNGEPTEVETTITVNYTLADDAPQTTAAGGDGPAAPDKALYERGMAAVAAKRYDVARLAFQTLVNTYRDSQYQYAARLGIAQSWETQGGSKALAQADLQYKDSGVAPMKIGNGVTAPMLVYTVDPEYTDAARKAKQRGTVVVSLWVDEQGKPLHVRVRKGLGNSLDQKAVEAVKQYRFKPATKDGKPVLVQLNVETNFQIF